MGTFVEIKVVGSGREKLHSAVNKAFEEMSRLEGMMSRYNDGSEVAALERGAETCVDVSQEMIDVVEKAVNVSILSGGLFDVTVGPFVRLWNFNEGEEKIPTENEIKSTLPLIGYRNIFVNRELSCIRLGKKGMRLTLGGIAKGYIVDRAMNVLRLNGVKNALINAGGDIKVIRESNEKPWRIGIQHPRDRQKIFATVDIYNGSIATSGDYERFFTRDGVRYHHILDPRTGMPAKSGVESVSIVANDSYYSDALATAVFVMGREKGLTLVERLKNVEGVIIDNKGRPWVSSGLKGRINYN